MHRWIPPLALALVACGPPPTRPAAVAPEPTPMVRLDNGLRLTVTPRPGTGVVAGCLAWPGGSRTASAAPAAPALLMEEALGGAGQPGLRARIEALGGAADGQIGPADARLCFTVARPQLAPALQALADALTGAEPREPLAAVQARLSTAQAIARRDPRRQRLERLLGEAAAELPPALPGEASLAAAPLDRLPALRRARWRPTTAALALVGDLTPAEGRAAAAPLERWTAEGRAPEPAPLRPEGPRIIAEDAPAGRLHLAWWVKARDAPAAAALDLVAALLAGPDGRLAEALRAADLRAVAPRAWPLLLGDGDALLVIEVEAPVDAAWRPLLRAVHGLAGRPPAPGRIETARRALLARRAQREDRPIAEAERLASQHIHWPGGPEAYDAALGLVDAAALAAAAQALTPNHLVAVLGDRVPDGVDPALWAEGLAEAASAAPPQQRPRRPGLISLGEGVEALIHPLPGARALTLLAVIETGPDDGRGLAPVIAAALAETDPGELHLEAEAAPDHLRLWITVGPDDLELAVAALARRLRALPWTPDRIARAQGRLRQARDTPDARADALTRGLLHGGARLDPDLDAAPAQLRAWYAHHVAAAPVRLVLVGPITARARDALAPLASGQRRPLSPALPPPEPTAAQPRTLREATDAPRGALRLAWRVPLDTAPALAQAYLLGELLVDPEGPLVDFLSRDGRGARARPFWDTDGPVGLIGVAIDGPVALLEQAHRAALSAAARAGSVVLDPGALRARQRHAIARLLQSLGPTQARARWLAGHLRSGRDLTGADGWRDLKGALERLSPVEAGAGARDSFTDAGRLQIEIGAPRVAKRAPAPDPLTRATPRPPMRTP